MEIMKIKEIRELDICELRTCCIKHEYFTMGTNDEYSAMFDFAKNMDCSNTAELYELCEMIYNHSDKDGASGMISSDCSKDDNILGLMWQINKDCIKVHYEIEYL